MFTIKKVTLDCFKDGLRQISMNLSFKKPGIELPYEYKEHKDIFKKKIRNWCCCDEYDQIVVRYKKEFDGELALIFKSEEIPPKKVKVPMLEVKL